MNPEAPSLKGISQKCWLILGIAAVLTSFFATKDYLDQLTTGGSVTPLKDIWWKAMEWYGWALFSPAIFWVCRKNDFNRGAWRLVGIQLMAAAVFALAHCCLVTTGGRIEAAVLHTGFTWGRLFKMIFVFYFHEDVLVYIGIVSIWYALDFHRQFRQREKQALELEVHLGRARLQALKTQLHPHFLFNTLNGIAALTHKNPKAANRMLVQLSELLRMSLDDDGAQEVALAKELEFNQRYLDLEKIRLGNRLTVRLEIDPETLDAFVPNLLLQPLVENALKHAIAPFSNSSQLTISTRRDSDTLLLQVKDTGPGIEIGPRFNAEPGVGLANTQARLRQLYGGAHTFELKNRDEGGLSVNISIPFRTNGASDKTNPAIVYEDSHPHRG